jgi:hypothetical protein
VLDIAHYLQMYLKLAEEASSSSERNGLFLISIPCPIFLFLIFAHLRNSWLECRQLHSGAFSFIALLLTTMSGKNKTQTAMPTRRFISWLHNSVLPWVIGLIKYVKRFQPLEFTG